MDAVRESATASEPTVETAPSPATPDPAALSERERDILDFERTWWRFAGAKEDAVRERFGLSATQYYQVLNALIDVPAAVAHDPVLVQRLRRMRATRRRGGASATQERPA